MSEGMPRFVWKGMPDSVRPKMQGVRRAIVEILDLAEGVPFTDLERELLAESLYKVRVLFDQIEHTVNAATDAERAEMRSLRALAGAVDQIEQDFQRDAMQDRIRRLQRAIRGDDDQREE